MKDETYNGWSSYETWVTKLWMDNDEGSYNFWNEVTQEIVDEAFSDEDDREEALNNAKYELSNRLESYHEEFMPETSGVFADLLNHALARVEWREIAQALLDDAEIPEATEAEQDYREVNFPMGPQ